MTSSHEPVADARAPVIIDFPLRGEWRAIQTPAERVPSHGTDFFAQRFAYDFVQMDPAGTRYGRSGLVRQLLGVTSADAFFAWNQPVFSAFAGHVVSVGNGAQDRRQVNSLWALLRGRVVPPALRGGDYGPLAGNFIVAAGGHGIALYAHLRRDSILVRRGDRVECGERLAAVGNSGNSTMPHLHFQLMDGPDPLHAAGVRCAFRQYERHSGDTWETVQRGEPGLLERVRVLAEHR